MPTPYINFYYLYKEQLRVLINACNYSSLSFIVLWEKKNWGYIVGILCKILGGIPQNYIPPIYPQFWGVYCAGFEKYEQLFAMVKILLPETIYLICCCVCQLVTLPTAPISYIQLVTLPIAPISYIQNVSLIYCSPQLLWTSSHVLRRGPAIYPTTYPLLSNFIQLSLRNSIAINISSEPNREGFKTLCILFFRKTFHEVVTVNFPNIDSNLC